MLTNFKSLLAKLNLTGRNVHLTSDTHFHHTLLVGARGYASLEEHDAALIETWNKYVGKDDVVLHLGDFILNDGDGTLAANILSQLNGTVLLLWGNHPSGIKRLYKNALNAKGLGDYDVYPIQITPNAWVVGDILDGVAYGVPFVACHFPITSWTDAGKGALLFCGHSHGSLPRTTYASWEGGKTQDIGWDVFNRPITLKEAVEIADAKPLVIVDHHGA